MGERDKRSKTGAADESLVLDMPRFNGWLGAAIAADRTQDELATDFILGHHNFGLAFTGACKVLKFTELGISCQYQLRHGGASTESLEGTGCSPDIMRRLMVTATKTFCRYENGGRLTEVAARLDHKMLSHCEDCENSISGILSETCQPLRL